MVYLAQPRGILQDYRGRKLPLSVPWPHLSPEVAASVTSRGTMGSRSRMWEPLSCSSHAALDANCHYNKMVHAFVGLTTRNHLKSRTSRTRGGASYNPNTPNLKCISFLFFNYLICRPLFDFKPTHL